MIKNIIFDVGNVLVLWDKELIAKSVFPKNEEACKIALEDCLKSPYWLEYDLGKESDETIKNKMKEKIPKDKQHYVDEFLANCTEHLQIIKEVNEWGIKMNKKGYKIYLLTNFPSTFPKFLPHLPIKDYIEGYVCSSEVKIMKPDKAVFELLFDKFNLKREECLFIDDVKNNTDAALEVGMGKVITFNGKVEQLEEFDK